MGRIHNIPNSEIVRILREIAIYLDMQSVPFKPRAYDKAADIIEGLAEHVRAIYERGGIAALEELPGVGLAIAEKIEELLRTGRLQYYEKLKKIIPVKLTELRAVEGLGPKSIGKLYAKLGVKNIRDLERAAKSGKVAKLEGFGDKSEERLMNSIEFLKGGSGRMPIFMVMPIVERLRRALEARPGVRMCTIAGSVRRRKETAGDADVLVSAEHAAPIMEYFVSLPEVRRVLASGETKSSVQLMSGLQVDLRVVPAQSYGAALNYFTGSKDHNVALRQLAMQKKLKLNEYGLWKAVGAKERMVAGKTEEEIYQALGLRYIEPEMRENTGEIEASRAGKLPKLIGYDDLKGDLQIQTDWTDGTASIETMARAAAEHGLEYIAITDHTHSLTITNGLDEKRIRKQWAEIDKVNAKLKAKSVRLTVLKGTECDIHKDGTLDLPDEILAKLDVVGISVHSHTKLSRIEQTARIVRAMENPHADILFHPTGRIVGARPPYDLDMETIIKAAKRTGTVLEANASSRLDLRDEHIRMAVEADVPLAIDSDAHAPEQFDLLGFGVAQARRGWAERSDIISAWPLEKMQKMLK